MNPMLKSNVSKELREQIINILDDLVDGIAPGYLLPNSFLPFNYRNAIYEEAYKSLSIEFGVRRLEYVDYRDEIFDFLRELASDKFFNVIHHLWNVLYLIVHIQIEIPDDFILNPNAGSKLWSRKVSIRNNHIEFFKEVVDTLNHRLAQSNVKCSYKLNRNSVQMVRLDTGLDTSKKESNIQEENGNIQEENSDIQEPKDNQTPKHHQNQSRGEFWNRKTFVFTVVGVIVAVLIFLFGDGILKPLLPWWWN